MEELLVVIIQCLVEAALYSPFDILAASRGDELPEFKGCGFFALYLIAGGIMGGLSLLILPRHLISSSSLRVANLFIAPILVASLSWVVAARLKSLKIARLPGNHFWTAFWFVLGLDAVRLAWGMH